MGSESAGVAGATHTATFYPLLLSPLTSSFFGPPAAPPDDDDDDDDG